MQRTLALHFEEARFHFPEDLSPLTAYTDTLGLLKNRVRNAQQYVESNSFGFGQELAKVDRQELEVLRVQYRQMLAHTWAYLDTTDSPPLHLLTAAAWKDEAGLMLCIQKLWPETKKAMGLVSDVKSL